MAAVRNGRGLLATMLPGPSAAELTRRVRARFAGAARDDRAFADLARDVRAYFAGRPARFDQAVDLSDLPAFTRTVLTALRKVGFGRTTTYGELARRVGRPRAARAVGGAMARNPLPLVIPCHRVLAGNNGLGGFSADGGVSLKQTMLEIEAEPAADRSPPTADCPLPPVYDALA
jgi:methylated-DNA-[protein]-cysteine S-methyltransferase